MLLSSALQFSVVREDPEVEIALFRKFGVQKPIMIGSGGCTALSLSRVFPSIPLSLIEPNSAQIALIKKKMQSLRSLRGAELAMRFTPRSSSKRTGMAKAESTLIEQGNFEALFRGLREFLYQFVAPRKTLQHLVRKGTRSEWHQVFKHAYWPTAFDLYFSDSLLRTMFGPMAIQHATPESYPRYFQSVLESGLLRADRAQNYFLHHILFGEYPTQKSSWPIYLQSPPRQFKISFFNGLAQDVPSYAEFDFVGLSNIFDWSTEQNVKSLARRLSSELKAGACVLYRQLNNTKNFERHLGRDFQWLKSEAQRLHKKDRSLFYSSLHIARKIR